MELSSLISNTVSKNAEFTSAPTLSTSTKTNMQVIPATMRIQLCRLIPDNTTEIIINITKSTAIEEELLSVSTSIITKPEIKPSTIPLETSSAITELQNATKPTLKSSAHIATYVTNLTKSHISETTGKVENFTTQLMENISQSMSEESKVTTFEIVNASLTAETTTEMEQITTSTITASTIPSKNITKLTSEESKLTSEETSTLLSTVTGSEITSKIGNLTTKELTTPTVNATSIPSENITQSEESKLTTSKIVKTTLSETTAKIENLTTGELTTPTANVTTIASENITQSISEGLKLTSEHANTILSVVSESTSKMENVTTKQLTTLAVNATATPSENITQSISEELKLTTSEQTHTTLSVATELTSKIENVSTKHVVTPATNTTTIASEESKLTTSEQGKTIALSTPSETTTKMENTTTKQLPTSTTKATTILSEHITQSISGVSETTTKMKSLTTEQLSTTTANVSGIPSENITQSTSAESKLTTSEKPSTKLSTVSETAQKMENLTAKELTTSSVSTTTIRAENVTQLVSKESKVTTGEETKPTLSTMSETTSKIKNLTAEQLSTTSVSVSGSLLENITQLTSLESKLTSEKSSTILSTVSETTLKMENLTTKQLTTPIANATGVPSEKTSQTVSEEPKLTTGEKVNVTLSTISETTPKMENLTTKPLSTATVNVSTSIAENITHVPSEESKLTSEKPSSNLTTVSETTPKMENRTTEQLTTILINVSASTPENVSQTVLEESKLGTGEKSNMTLSIVSETTPKMLNLTTKQLTTAGIANATSISSENISQIASEESKLTTSAMTNASLSITPEMIGKTEATVASTTVPSENISQTISAESKLTTNETGISITSTETTLVVELNITGTVTTLSTVVPVGKNETIKVVEISVSNGTTIIAISTEGKTEAKDHTELEMVNATTKEAEFSKTQSQLEENVTTSAGSTTAHTKSLTPELSKGEEYYDEMKKKNLTVEDFDLITEFPETVLSENETQTVPSATGSELPSGAMELTTSNKSLEIINELINWELETTTSKMKVKQKNISTVSTKMIPTDTDMKLFTSPNKMSSLETKEELSSSQRSEITELERINASSTMSETTKISLPYSAEEKNQTVTETSEYSTKVSNTSISESDKNFSKTTRTTISSQIPSSQLSIKNTSMVSQDGDECDTGSASNSLTSCLCSIDNVLDDISKLISHNFPQNISVFDQIIDQYTCHNFINVKNGFTLTPSIHPTASGIKRFLRDLLKKKDSMKNNQLQDILTQNTIFENTNEHVFAKPTKLVTIPCGEFDDTDVESSQLTFNWLDSAGKSLTFGKISPTTGTLTIDSVTPQMDGNYTCVVEKDSEKIAKNSHQLSVVLIPHYTLMSSFLYNISEKCSRADIEIINLYLANLLTPHVCGSKMPICTLRVNKAQCIFRKDMSVRLSFNLVVEMKHPERIIAHLNASYCDLNCELKIYVKLFSIVCDSLPKLLHVPVFFRFNYSQQDLYPEITPIMLNNGLVQVLTTCDAGFELKKEISLCGPCEKNSFNPGNSPTCTKCSLNTYQHSKGSTTCTRCNSLFEDKNCVLSYADFEQYSFYVWACIGIFLLFFAIIIYLIFFKTPKTVYDIKDEDRTREKAKRNQKMTEKLKQRKVPTTDQTTDYDVESARLLSEPPPEPEVETDLLSNYPRKRSIPRVPPPLPPDFDMS